jgi:galactonate dehydratase
MRITEISSRHAAAGFRTFDFLKISTDTGVVGWSEYSESYGGRGITAVIDALAPSLLGRDPRAIEALRAELAGSRRTAPGGVVSQAIGAIENALLDVKARALGVPVYELFGGPVRDRIRLYWSHLATWRVSFAEQMSIPAVRSLDDVVAAAAEVVERGFSALKTNLVCFDGGPRSYAPGLRGGRGAPELNADRSLVRALGDQLAAIREGAGPAVDLMVDLNVNYRTEGFITMARAMEAFDATWVELDTHDPVALRSVRDRTTVPVASCETLSGRREYRPFLEARAADVVIVDALWNGVGESLKIAAMADAFDVNVAPHNYYSHLATMMSAHFAALVPNLRIMEIDLDVVPWQDQLVTVLPRLVDGHLLVPEGPGWGTEIVEEALLAHPPAG